MENSQGSTKQLSEDIKFDNTIDKHRVKKEQKQLQRIVHKISIKNLDA